MTGLVSSFWQGPAPPLSIGVIFGTQTAYQILPYGSQTIVERVFGYGGVPPYTFLATYVSGDTSITVTGAATDTVTFSATGDGTPINTQEVVYNFTVTDAALTAVSEQCTIGFVFGLNPP